MPELHPGCLVATITYQEQCSTARCKRMNADSVRRAAHAASPTGSAEIAARHPHGDVDLDALADNVTVVVEGAIILSKVLADRKLMGRQMRLFRDYVRRIFGAP